MDELKSDRTDHVKTGSRDPFRSRARTAILFLYALQLFTVGYWRLVPVDRRDHNGVTYSIHRGGGGWSDFVPALPMVLSADSVYVLTNNLQTAGTSIRHYDFLGAAYLDHEEVWPEK